MPRRRKQQKAKSPQHSGTRNQYALRAHFRHAGAMHDRRLPRGGASDQQQKWLDEYLDEKEQGEETEEHDDEEQEKTT